MILKLNGKGNTKQAVRAYRLLMGFPMEDTFTVALQTATKNFQLEKGLKADGIAGPLTLAALVDTLPEVKYKDYSGSEYVRAVQALVSTAVDGKYGANTRANVMAALTAGSLSGAWCGTGLGTGFQACRMRSSGDRIAFSRTLFSLNRSRNGFTTPRAS